MVMREILFRGKSVNDGDWVHGSLVVTTIEPADDTPIKHYHIEDMTIGVFPNEFQSGLSETVDPETIGQYTGLTDKNGKKIFEGDVLRWVGPDGESGKVSVEFAGGVFGFLSVECPNTPPDLFGDFKDGDQTLEVIGNIHDNPELLEVKTDHEALQ